MFQNPVGADRPFFTVRAVRGQTDPFHFPLCQRTNRPLSLSALSEDKQTPSTFCAVRGQTDPFHFLRCQKTNRPLPLSALSEDRQTPFTFCAVRGQTDYTFFTSRAVGGQTDPVYCLRFQSFCVLLKTQSVSPLTLSMKTHLISDCITVGQLIALHLIPD